MLKGLADFTFVLKFSEIVFSLVIRVDQVLEWIENNMGTAHLR